MMRHITSQKSLLHRVNVLTLNILSYLYRGLWRLAGIGTGENHDLSILLGHNTSVFQAEMHAVRLSVSTLKTLDLPDEQIYICSDSRAMLMVLCNPRVT